MCNKLISRGHAIIALWWEKLKESYPRYEKYGPLSAFILGFIYDTLTLTRIDRWLDNLVLLGYVAMAGVLIALIGMVEHGRIRGGWVVRHPDLITSGAHFFLGGLLSSYVVFYFKSAAVGKTFLFVALLVGLMVANEFLTHRLRDLKLLFSLYYFCCFAFLTFFLPVVTHVMGSAMFITGGLLSLIPPGIVSALICPVPQKAPNVSARMNPERALLPTQPLSFGVKVLNFPQGHRPKATGVNPWYGVCRGRSRLVSLEWLGTMGMPVVIFFAVVFFYFQNWIPPVPLALKEGGIYRSVKRLGDQYEVQYREPSWYQFWRSDEREFIYAQVDAVYCFTAVFAPTALKERIIHHWQRRTGDGEWVTTDTMNYSIVGGRDGGYRGFTFKKGITLGRWRVEVKTAEGRLLGRIPFEVISSESAPARIKTTYR